MRFRCLFPLLLLLPGLLKATDSVFVADEVMLLLPGLRAVQANENNRQFILYQSGFKVLMVPPMVSTKGVIMWWGALKHGYWRMGAEWALVPPGSPPRHWRPLSLGAIVADTLLPIGARLEGWIRFAGKGTGRLIFRVERPALTPVCKGYLIKDQMDTVGLHKRAAHMADRLAEVLPWKPLQEPVQRLMADQTAELYFQAFPGMPDSCLEYQVQVADGSQLQTQWQRTGHLLRLPPLPAGARYRLLVRYQDMSSAVGLQLRVDKYWYQQTLWRMLWLLTLVVTLPVLYSIRSRRRLRMAERRNNELQNKWQLLNSQLNPHFVYNAISSMAGIVAAKEFEKATMYLSEFGQLLREVLKYSQSEQPYTLREELQMLDRYCHLEQLRFGFSYEIMTDPDLRPSEVFLPPLLVQPLVENAILHGAQVLQDKGAISISYLREGSDLLVRVTDNGPGISETPLHRGFGLGLELTRKRISYLSDLMQMEIRFSLTREGPLSVARICFYQWFD